MAPNSIVLTATAITKLLIETLRTPLNMSAPGSRLQNVILVPRFAQPNRKDPPSNETRSGIESVVAINA
jgi:hypothetical protein